MYVHVWNVGWPGNIHVALYDTYNSMNYIATCSIIISNIIMHTIYISPYPANGSEVYRSRRRRKRRRDRIKKKN